MMSVLSIFLVSPFHFCLCVFPAFARSDLIAMCTVDKIKDEILYMKRLLHYHEQKIEIVLPEKLMRVILTDKQESEKNKLK